MTSTRSPGLAVVALVLVLVACASGCAGAPAGTVSDVGAPGRSPGPVGSPGAEPSEVAPAERAESVVRPRPPRLAVLPSGRTVRVDAVGTTTTGLLDVPPDVEVAGWWRGGSRIGDPFGSVLVAAHVDSRAQGLGPFAELLTVRAGSRVVLESAGLRQAFEVESRRLVPQGSLVDDSWIFDASGDLRLTLVTCAPPYDAARGGYQHLAVVTAVPLGPAEAA